MARLKTQKGAVLIEFAFVAIILIILFGGIVELGLSLYNKNVLDNASRVGARAAIAENAVNVDQKIIDYCSGRLINLVDGRVENLTAAISTGAFSISIAPDGDGDVVVTIEYLNPSLLGNMINSMLQIMGAGQIGLDNIPIQAETVMRPE